MRTTVDIPDGLYRQLKAKAAGEGRSVKSLLLEAAQRGLAKAPRPMRRVRLPLIRGKRPGTLDLTNAQIEQILIATDIA